MTERNKSLGGEPLLAALQTGALIVGVPAEMLSCIQGDEESKLSGWVVVEGYV